jgi:hypothetical protein
MSLLTLKQYIDQFTGTPQALTTGEGTLDRSASLTPSVAMVTQVAYFTFFTAKKTATINTLTTFVATPSSGTAPTLCRLGVYSVDSSGNFSTIVATANNTNLWNTSQVAAPQGLNAAWSKVAGNRYAIMALCVSAGTLPTLIQANASTDAVTATILGRAPRVCGQMTGQTDVPFPGPFADSTFVNNNRALYVECS